MVNVSNANPPTLYSEGMPQDAFLGLLPAHMPDSFQDWPLHGRSTRWPERHAERADLNHATQAGAVLRFGGVVGDLDAQAETVGVHFYPSDWSSELAPATINLRCDAPQRFAVLRGLCVDIAAIFSQAPQDSPTAELQTVFGVEALLPRGVRVESGAVRGLVEHVDRSIDASKVHGCTLRTAANTIITIGRHPNADPYGHLWQEGAGLLLRVVSSEDGSLTLGKLNEAPLSTTTLLMEPS